MDHDRRNVNSAPMAVRCPCGLELAARGEPALVSLVNGHLSEQHPLVAGNYSDDDILALAYRTPG
jgi:hypothetical protein